MNDLPHWIIREHLKSGSPTVWVTGLGLVTALDPVRVELPGSSALSEVHWGAIRGGRSAVRTVRIGEMDDFACSVTEAGGEIPSEESRTIHLRGDLHAASDAAFRDAGLGRLNFDRDRAACLVGLSKGNVSALSSLHRMTRQGRLESAEFEQANRLHQMGWPNFAASNLSGRYGLRGPSISPIAACATGLIAAIQGAELIRRGICDIALVGAADASVDTMMMAAFRNMKALAKPCGDPSAAIRPWDRDRRGFVVGEGAAVIVLERADHAKARDVLPYAEFAGGAFGSDAYHITNLNPDPSGLAHVIGLALTAAEVQASDLDHINVHGTATRQNDPLECRAIRKALGSHADSVSCSANKPQIGHLLGAAGAAELAITCLAMRDGFVPPTLNLDHPDPACDLDGTPHVGKNREIRAALKLSIGFGGHLAAAVLRKPDGLSRGPVPAP